MILYRNYGMKFILLSFIEFFITHIIICIIIYFLLIFFYFKIIVFPFINEFFDEFQITFHLTKKVIIFYR